MYGEIKCTSDQWISEYPFKGSILVLTCVICVCGVWGVWSGGGGCVYVCAIIMMLPKRALLHSTFNNYGAVRRSTEKYKINMQDLFKNKFIILNQNLVQLRVF